MKIQLLVLAFLCLVFTTNQQAFIYNTDVIIDNDSSFYVPYQTSENIYIDSKASTYFGGDVSRYSRSDDLPGYILYKFEQGVQGLNLTYWWFFYPQNVIEWEINVYGIQENSKRQQLIYNQKYYQALTEQPSKSWVQEIQLIDFTTMQPLPQYINISIQGTSKDKNDKTIQAETNSSATSFGWTLQVGDMLFYLKKQANTEDLLSNGRLVDQSKSCNKEPQLFNDNCQSFKFVANHSNTEPISKSINIQSSEGVTNSNVNVFGRKSKRPGFVSYAVDQGILNMSIATYINPQASCNISVTAMVLNKTSCPQNTSMGGLADNTLKQERGVTYIATQNYFEFSQSLNGCLPRTVMIVLNGDDYDKCYFGNVTLAIMSELTNLTDFSIQDPNQNQGLTKGKLAAIITPLAFFSAVVVVSFMGFFFIRKKNQNMGKNYRNLKPTFQEAAGNLLTGDQSQMEYEDYNQDSLYLSQITGVNNRKGGGMKSKIFSTLQRNNDDRYNHQFPPIKENEIRRQPSNKGDRQNRQFFDDVLKKSPSKNINQQQASPNNRNQKPSQEGGQGALRANSSQGQRNQGPVDKLAKLQTQEYNMKGYQKQDHYNANKKITTDTGSEDFISRGHIKQRPEIKQTNKNLLKTTNPNDSRPQFDHRHHQDNKIYSDQRLQSDQRVHSDYKNQNNKNMAPPQDNELGIEDQFEQTVTLDPKLQTQTQQSSQEQQQAQEQDEEQIQPLRKKKSHKDRKKDSRYYQKQIEKIRGSLKDQKQSYLSENSNSQSQKQYSSQNFSNQSQSYLQNSPSKGASNDNKHIQQQQQFQQQQTQQQLQQQQREYEGKDAKSKKSKSSKLYMVRKIGQGGFGTVYKAMWEGYPVAVKIMVIPASMAGQEKQEKMALMETAISGSLKHQNIVQTYQCEIRPLFIRGFGPSSEEKNRLQMQKQQELQKQMQLQSGEKKADPQGYMNIGDFQQSNISKSFYQPDSQIHSWEIRMIMEFCDQLSMREGIKQKRWLDESQPLGRKFLEIILTVRDIAKGLHLIHAAKIIHGDLKPHNILLKSINNDERGYIGKIADFGLSIKLEQECSHLSNINQGTEGYIAPEIQLERKISTKSDIYAYGILLWEIYNCKSFYEELQQQKLKGNKKVTFRPSFPQGTPDWYESCAKVCWDADPEKRPEFHTLVDLMNSKANEWRSLYMNQPNE